MFYLLFGLLFIGLLGFGAFTVESPMALRAIAWFAGNGENWLDESNQRPRRRLW